MIIRDATKDDYDSLIRIGRCFAKTAGQSDVDEESLKATLDALLERGVLKVAENGAVCGAAGAILFPHYWNFEEIIAQELFWWVDEYARGTTAGTQLLVALEQGAKDRGAEKLLMLCLDAVEGDKVAQMYERRGYTPLERTYAKELQ